MLATTNIDYNKRTQSAPKLGLTKASLSLVKANQTWIKSIGGILGGVSILVLVWAVLVLA